MDVITMSRQMGSEGDHIASLVSSMLDYRLVDRQAVIIEAQKRGLMTPEIAHEVIERRPPFLAKFDERRIKAVYSIRSMVREIAAKGEVVFIGLGANLELKDHTETFDVRLIADLETRIARMEQESKLNRGRAVKALKQGDRESAEYVRHFFLSDWSDPQLYDFVINTTKIPPDVAARSILQATYHLRPARLCLSDG